MPTSRYPTADGDRCQAAIWRNLIPAIGRQFSISDMVALAAASSLLIIFVFLGSPGAALGVALAPGGCPVYALAGLAEAAADRASSEIGMAFPGQTVLITSWHRVPAGMDGGISIRGTSAAVAAAAVIAAIGRVAGLVTGHQASLVMYAGFLGTLGDSVL